MTNGSAGLEERQPVAYVELDGVGKRYAELAAVVDLTLSVGRGEFFSLLGPSGCGKTTTLRVIAGLEPLTTGTVAIDGCLASSPGYTRPPEKRGVGIVFQDYALFPHLRVEENIGFGLHGQAKPVVAGRVAELLELVGLGGMGKKYPHQLSGGQKQRVALARSLAPCPSVMLLDEPFSNLDAELREGLRRETKEILKAGGTTVILVTHDQEEAFSLSDRIGLLHAGRLEQVGTPYQVYHNPASRFVAGFVGKVDYFPARVHGNLLVTELGTFPHYGVPAAEVVDVMVRPDDVRVFPDPQGEAVIADAQFLGAEALYRLELPNGQSLHSAGLSANLLPRGTRVRLSVDLPHTVCFPRSGQ
ncbi:MAG TPA: ABC transporter ATP-binding protein [Clostridiales bacterium UBA8153]|nr:ABC transporter ATP-binding protein [Clostridiales bacterium UBA8153]